MARGKRARLTLDERRAQLVALGRELFRDRPYDAVGIDEIAAAAGISKGLLYHYFPSKRAFYVAVLRQAAQEIEERTALDPALGDADRLRAGIDAYLDYVDENAGGYAAVLRAGAGVDPEVAAIIDDVRARLAERVLAGVPAERRAEPATRLAVRGWIGFGEAASLEWAERHAVERATVRELLVATLAAALAAAAEA
jgi:AcrR family transcriptional regulator